MDQDQQGPADLLTADGAPYLIPEEGSLALLALGYQGIMAWRARKYELRAARKQKIDEEKA